jgi:hypothetical protein
MSTPPYYDNPFESEETVEQQHRRIARTIRENVDKREGVAAPLEPTTARQWLSDELDRRGIPESAKEKMLRPNDISVELLEAYAAAVSKNLQEELARLKSEVAVRDEWLRFIDAKDLKIYHELKMRAGKSPR